VKLRLATRGSDLALWQARHVADSLRKHHGTLEIELTVIRTTGDRVSDAPLSRIGSIGLFTAEIDRAVLDGTADIAVHSLKDVPTVVTPGIRIGAVLEREDPRDAFVPAPGRARTLRELPSGSRVATSSLRRRSLLLALRPDLVVEDLRGNLDTRLAKLAGGAFDAALLALAGLRRIGREQTVGELLGPPDWLPAVGQGALAVTHRDDDRRTAALTAPLAHRPTHVAVTAERALLRRFQGGCQVPVGALATLASDRLTVHAFVGSLDGRRVARAERSGNGADPEGLAEAVAAELDALGASEIIAEVRAANAAPPVHSP
jgi:hydroxymethylbilane synthase